MNNLQKQVLEQCLSGTTEGTLSEIRTLEDLPLDVIFNLETLNVEDSLLQEDAPLWDEVEIYMHDHYREQRRMKRTVEFDKTVANYSQE
jgi:hypothetical protein